MELTKVYAAGPETVSVKTTIPEYIVKRFGIRSGESLSWEEEDGRILIEVVKSIGDADFDALIKQEIKEHYDVFQAFKDAESIKAIE